MSVTNGSSDISKNQGVLNVGPNGKESIWSPGN